MPYKRKGFTLIELIIVMVIIGILASIAVPMFRGNVDKAKKTEAIAVLGAIKTAVKAYYAEYGAWPKTIFKGGFLNPNHLLHDYINTEDLNGTFFDANCYGVFGVFDWNGNGAFIRAQCEPARSTRPRRSEVNKLSNMQLWMNGQLDNY